MTYHESLAGYYLTNHTLLYYYKYSLKELEEMYPYEREIYIELLNKQVKEENEKRSKR